ncbi:MAG: hypothetical protein PHC61_11600 [Chitinivibrionales bacterium]|nr:hypothetical protein [Chitinivibrionales bacterium]
MTQLNKSKNGFRVKGSEYSLTYDKKNKFYISLKFNNGLGAQLFIPSACDQAGAVDRVTGISAPSLKKMKDGKVLVSFTGGSDIWKKKHYYFECRNDTVIYKYAVEGSGTLETAWFFEGFLKDDPKTKHFGFPYFAGLSREKSYHRPLNEFSRGSKPHYDLFFAPTINSSDTRYFMYYKNMVLRVDGSRTFLGGDWLVTPPPFCYLMGTKEKKDWLSLGLAVKPGQYNFFGYHYMGGEEFGLNLDYRGHTKVSGTWESPAIVFQPSKDEYEGLKQYVTFLQDDGFIAKPKREIADWWSKPIFCCWGEQMYMSDKWDCYLTGDPKTDIGSLSSRKFFDGLLKKLESYKINPGTLIIDNRWASPDDEFTPDPKSWGDMRDFIDKQHAKGRKIILWSAPFSHAQSSLGTTIPEEECIIADGKIEASKAWYNIDIYNPEDIKSGIDTDIFYPGKHNGKKPVLVKKQNKPVPIFVDPTNPKYEKRLREKIRFTLSPEGLDADGYKFDYTHYIPTARDAKLYGNIWGIELLKKLIWIYYDEAKKVKKDAMIISHTYNPYFSDVVDMCRIQDLYTDQKSIVEAAMHRAKIGRIACPGCLIDSDNHPVVSLATWEEYMKAQPSIGVPAMYYISGIEVTYEKLKPEHFKMVSRIWDKYEKELKKNK